MHPISRCAAAIVIVTSGLISSAHAATFDLFDTSLGSLPNAQGHLFFGDQGISQTLTGQAVDLDSTGGGDNGRGGYTNFGFPPVLDRSNGVNLDFDLQVISEDHSASSNRSGFSIIVLTSDLQGIELGFWENEVWAQKGDFTQGEGASFNTTSALTSYSLQILGSSYSLFADGLSLSGQLRDYSSNNIAVGGVKIYAIANHIFIGDVTLTTAVVPLPPSVVLSLVAFATTLSMRRKPQAKNQAPIT
jgi:hypothetical protein